MTLPLAGVRGPLGLWAPPALGHVMGTFPAVAEREREEEEEGKALRPQLEQLLCRAGMWASRGDLTEDFRSAAQEPAETGWSRGAADTAN